MILELLIVLCFCFLFLFLSCFTGVGFFRNTFCWTGRGAQKKRGKKKKRKKKKDFYFEMTHWFQSEFRKLSCFDIVPSVPNTTTLVSRDSVILHPVPLIVAHEIDFLNLIWPTGHLTRCSLSLSLFFFFFSVVFFFVFFFFFFSVFFFLLAGRTFWDRQFIS